MLSKPALVRQTGAGPQDQIPDGYVLVAKGDMKQDSVPGSDRKAIAPSAVSAAALTSMTRIERLHPFVGAAAAGGLTLPTVTVTVPLAVTLSASAGGVVASVTSIDPTTVSEASALDTLWNECKVLGGHYDFVLTANAAEDQQIVMVYDPSDASSALSSVVQGSQYAGHKLFALGGLTSSINGASISTYAGGRSWSFPFHVPKGVKLGTTIGGAWSATGTSVSYGSLKVYALGTASQAIISGILYLKISYRSRH